MARRRSAAHVDSNPERGDLVHFPGSSDPPLLLRIPVGSPNWAETMPPTPVGVTVTVAFSDEDVEAEHGDALELLGYVSVGVVPLVGDAGATVDLLLSRAMCDRWPRWRDQLMNAGGRVWDLGFGPVAAMMGPAAAVHPEPSSR